MEWTCELNRKITHYIAEAIHYISRGQFFLVIKIYRETEIEKWRIHCVILFHSNTKIINIGKHCVNLLTFFACRIGFPGDSTEKNIFIILWHESFSRKI